MAKTSEDMGSFSTHRPCKEGFFSAQGGLLPLLPSSWDRTEPDTGFEDLIKATWKQGGSSSVCLSLLQPPAAPVGDNGEELFPAPTPPVSTWDNPFSLLEMPGLLREYTERELTEWFLQCSSSLEKVRETLGR